MKAGQPEEKTWTSVTVTPVHYMELDRILHDNILHELQRGRRLDIWRPGCLYRNWGFRVCCFLIWSKKLSESHYTPTHYLLTLGFCFRFLWPCIVSKFSLTSQFTYLLLRFLGHVFRVMREVQSGRKKEFVLKILNRKLVRWKAQD